MFGHSNKDLISANLTLWSICTTSKVISSFCSPSCQFCHRPEDRCAGGHQEAPPTFPVQTLRQASLQRTETAQTHEAWERKLTALSFEKYCYIIFRDNSQWAVFLLPLADTGDWTTRCFHFWNIAGQVPGFVSCFYFLVFFVHLASSAGNTACLKAFCDFSLSSVQLLGDAFHGNWPREADEDGKIVRRQSAVSSVSNAKGTQG